MEDREKMKNCARARKIKFMHKEMHRRKKIEHKEFHKKINELYFFCRYINVFKNITFVITVVIALFVCKFIGFKIATFIIVFVLIINEGTIIYMVSRMEKRFIRPMAKLQTGVRKIAEGDYSVRLKTDNENEIALLTEEFNKMAQKLDESEKIKIEYEKNRKDLIANISHDLKTPITSINGYIEGILEGVVPEEKVYRYLKTIKSNSAYMNRLIDDLFLFSKLDMQKLEFSFSKINIENYLNDIVEEFNFMLEEKQIGFYYIKESTENVFVSLDGKRLYRAIRNIVDNAIKYGASRNDLKIEISLYSDKEEVFIIIADNGPGIEKDKVEKIFQRFYRVDKERTKDFNSTGLGLAISKEIIDAHKGKIYVNSEVNVGTAFTIKLPILNSEEN